MTARKLARSGPTSDIIVVVVVIGTFPFYVKIYSYCDDFLTASNVVTFVVTVVVIVVVTDVVTVVVTVVVSAIETIP